MLLNERTGQHELRITTSVEPNKSSLTKHWKGNAMSRTFKDRPDWVRSNDRREEREIKHSYRCGIDRTCNLDEPLSHKSSMPAERRLGCRYRPLDTETDAPRWYRKCQFFAPQRLNLRAAVNRMCDEYNTLGEVIHDTCGDGIQARRGAWERDQ